jgi:RNA polymerase primary sigma factor
LSDDLPSPYVDAVEDAASHAWLVAALDDALAGLSAREQEVIRLRFGLLDGKPRTLEEVGQEFGVTRERIRQIEHKALKKLRHPQHASRLLEYYGATPTHKDHDDARDRSA